MTACRRFCGTLVFALFLASFCHAAQNATIQGYVKNQKTGMPNEGVWVDVYKSDDHSKSIASMKTDAQGFYSAEVPAGFSYDVYVRAGDPNPNQRTSNAVEPSGVYTLNFKIDSETNYSEVSMEKYGFWIVVIVAVLILLIILIDQLLLRKKRVMRELETERDKLKKRIEEGDKSEPGSELERLQKERDQIDYMINLTKIKFHKRKIDEESFREIARDYQKKLIEVEAKIDELTGEEKKDEEKKEGAE